MTCRWCVDCVENDADYDGQVLLIHRAEGWELRPWHPDGLGGGALAVAVELLPEWLNEVQVGQAVRGAANVIHDHREVVLVDWGDAASFIDCRSAVATAAGGQWGFASRGHRPVLVSLPSLVLEQTEQDRLRGTPGWIASDDGVQFEDVLSAISANKVAHWRSEREKVTRPVPERQRGNPRGFVNPYNFIPLGRKGADRQAPVGHLKLAEQLRSGRIRVTMTAKSLLALGSKGSGETSEQPKVPLWDSNAECHYIAGSSLAGPVRAFHEALTDSCLRVVDKKFLPVYRDVAKMPNQASIRMGIIKRVGDKVSVQYLKAITSGGAQYPAVWVRKNQISGRVCTSERYHVTGFGAAPVVNFGKLTFDNPISLTPCAVVTCKLSHWRTIIAEPIEGRQGANHWLPFAEEDPGAPFLDALDKLLPEYEAAARGSRDVRDAKAGRLIILDIGAWGTRAQVHETLQHGDLMWVTLNGGKPERASPSVLWRNRGAGAVQDRIAGYEPCTAPPKKKEGNDKAQEQLALCPSCALFGMVHERDEVDKADADANKAELAAYRGHVRFGSIRFRDLDEEPTHLTEMGSPRPGSGQFYLENGEDAARRQAPKPDGRPFREWGAQPDRSTSGPRRIAGRKRWWATSTTDRHSRGTHEAMATWQMLTRVGAKLTATVWFDNLTESQLGALLISISPDVLRTDGARERLGAMMGGEATREAHLKAIFDSPEGFVSRIGKGKGVGLGSVGVKVELEAWGPDRYRNPDSAKSEQEVSGYVEVFLDELAHAGTEDGLPERLLGLLSMSVLDWVAPERVTYPPDDSIKEDFAFDFWKNSTGAGGTVLEDTYRPVLITQPKPHKPDVSIQRPWLRRG